MALRGKMENSHVMAKIIVWLGCIFVMFSLTVLVIALITQGNPLSDINTLKWIQLLQTITLFLLPSLMIAYLGAKAPFSWLQLDKKADWKVFLWAVGIMLVALPAINLLAQWNQQMVLPTWLSEREEWMKNKEAEAEWLTKQFMSATTVSAVLVNLFLMAVLPAVSEEITFRGVLMKLFKVRGERLEVRGESIPHLAIWCSAILFSAIHMQFYGFVPRMLMGALFGYMLVWTGSLWVPILMHFTNNAMAVLLYFVSLRAGWDMEEVDAIGTNDTLWLGVVSMILTIVGIYAFRRSTTMSNASSRMSNGN